MRLPFSENKNLENSVYSRIVGSIGANIFAQVVNIGYQFIQVPLFLFFWKKEYYGEWLVLYAIPSVMTLADGGFGTIAANEAAMLAGGGKPAEAQSVLNSNWTMQVRILGTFAILLIPLAFLISPAAILNLNTISHYDAAIVTLLLSWGVFAGMPSTLILGIYRSEKLNARGTVCLNCIRLLNLIGIAVALSLKGGMKGVALSFLLSQIAGVFLMWRDAKKVSKMRLKLDRIDWQIVRRELGPALSFQLFPVGNGLYFQGQTLLINGFMGPAEVVTFNAARTMSRVVAQFGAVLKHSAWPEFSLLAAHSRSPVLRGLLINATRITTVGAILLGAAIVFAGPSCLSWWTHQKVVVPRSFLALLTLSAVLNAAWAVPAGFLQATNRHVLLAWLYAVGCGLGLAAGVSTRSYRLFGVAYSMIGVELFMCVVVIWITSSYLRLFSADIVCE